MNFILPLTLLCLGLGVARGVCEEHPDSGKSSPPDSIRLLSSEEFAVREKAQTDLLDWARKHGEPAVAILVERSSSSDDPETRSRCLSVLRDIAMDDFDNEGEGYIGINMQDVFVPVPGDPLPRAGIRVGVVVENSAAAEAGIQAGDVIVGLGDELWREFPISEKFGKEIREIKPRSKVTLKVLRGEKVLNIEVVLRRRPPIPKTFFQLEDANLDIEALSKAEKEAFFRNWLKTRRLKK
jgi:hypothetical protein